MFINLRTFCVSILQLHPLKGVSGFLYDYWLHFQNADVLEAKEHTHSRPKGYMINVESLSYNSVLEKKLNNKFLYKTASIILEILAFVLEANFDRRICHALGLFEML